MQEKALARKLVKHRSNVEELYKSYKSIAPVAVAGMTDINKYYLL